METSTIILLSVLSTLAVVAIVATIVVAFSKLGRRINNLAEETNTTFAQRSDEINNDINYVVNNLNSSISELKREMDSRFDKFDNKLKLSTMNLANSAGPVSQTETKKEILQG